jgi:hypothetical protein
MRVLYFLTRGANDPTGASLPLHLVANGSLAVGHDIARWCWRATGPISPGVPPARRSTGWACRSFVTCWPVTCWPRWSNTRCPSTSDSAVGLSVG